MDATTSVTLDLPDGRTLRAHATTGDPDAGVVVWHHGTPQSGALLAPVVEAAARRGLRVVSYGRPSYGGSSARPGRDVASAAGDVAARGLADVRRRLVGSTTSRVRDALEGKGRRATGTG